MGYNRVVAHRRAFRPRLRARAKGGGIDAARLRRRTDGGGTARVGGGFRADGNGIQAAQSPGGAGAGAERGRIESAGVGFRAEGGGFVAACLA